MMGPTNWYLISDSAKDEKLSIPEGETTIGRGPFLKVKDKRVSRLHAIISLKDGCLRIKPIHSNPTFFWPGDGKYSILKQNEWKILNNDDKISLLPSDLFFSVEVIQNPDAENNKEESVPSNCQASETIANNGQSYLEEAKENKVLQNVSKSVDKDKASKLAASAERAQEDTFEDSIDSLEDEKFGPDIKNVLYKGTQMGHINESDGSKLQNTGNCLKTNDAKTELVSSLGKDATVGSLREKKRLLPSWMLTSSPTKSAARAKKDAAKASTGGSLKRKIKGDHSFEKNRQDEKDTSSSSCSVSKRSKEDDTPIQGVVDCSTSGISIEGNDTKCIDSTFDENRGQDSKENDTILSKKVCKPQHRLKNAINCEANEVRWALSNDGEKRKLPLNSDDKNSISEIRKADEKTPEVVIAGEVKGMDRPKGEGFQSGASVQSQGFAEEYSTGEAVEVVKKLPKCQYGKSCYRKNPVHLQEYSHSDIDSDGDGQSETIADNKPECPYGTSCYRKNPQHKIEYNHTKNPSGQRNSTRRIKRKSSRLQTRPKKSALDGDSDDDGEGNDYDYDDSFIDDNDTEGFQSGSSSSYQDDDDDDDDENWSPDDLE